MPINFERRERILSRPVPQSAQALLYALVELGLDPVLEALLAGEGVRLGCVGCPDMEHLVLRAGKAHRVVGVEPVLPAMDAHDAGVAVDGASVAVHLLLLLSRAGLPPQPHA